MDHHYVVGVNTELGPEEWKRDPATTGARTWDVSVGACDDEVTRRQQMSTTVSLPAASDVQFQRSVHGTWSDAEVDFKQRAPVRWTSGYASADGTVHDGLSRESHRATDEAGLRQNQNNGLKSPSHFSTLSTVYPTRQAMPGGEECFTVTQHQSTEIVRRACQDVTATPSVDTEARPKQLNYDSPFGAPSTQFHVDGHVIPEPADRRGRSTVVGRSAESAPAGTTPGRVRWRSPSADDEFFDAPQSPSRSRSRSSARSVSRGGRSASRDQPSTPSMPGDVNTASGTQECNSSVRRQPSHPGDDSNGERDGKKPDGRDSGRRRSPSPPPSRGAPATRPLDPRKWMKPDKFSGTGSVETFLAQFDICAAYNGWTDKDKAAHLKCCLTGVAGQLLWDTGRPDALTYSELREKLRRRFGSDDQQEKFQAELRARRRRKGETLAELYQDVRRLMTLAYPGEGSSSLCEQIAKDYFIAALGDRDLELKIREREPRDLESAFKHAVRIEAYEKAVLDEGREQNKGKWGRGKQDDGLSRKVAQLERKVEQVTTQQPAATPRTATEDRNVSTSDTTVKELKEVVAQLTRRNDELSKEVGRIRLLEEQRKEASTMPVTPTCMAPPSTSDSSPRSARVPPKCYYCGGLGHFIRDCEKRKTQVEHSKGVTGIESRDNSEVIRGQTYLRLVVNGKSSKCLLDTGSDVTLLPSSLTSGVQLEPTARRIRAANGTAIKVNGTATVEANAGAHHMTITGLVSPHVNEVMLGIGFLKQERAIWNFDLGEVILSGFRHKLCARGRQSWCRRVILQDDTMVPAVSEMDVSTLMQYSDLSGPKLSGSVSWVTEAREVTPGVCTSRTVVPDRGEDVPVRVINVTRSPVVMKAGTVVSDLDPAWACETPDTSSSADCHGPGPELLGMVDGVDESVSDNDRRRLISLLTEFSDTFSKHENDLGWTNVVTHAIDTRSSRPVRQPLRRHPPAHTEAIQQHVSNMLEQEVIEPTKSPWASNLVLVKKKDGSLRCCVDYRQVNTLTKKDAYPLPRTDMCLDAMSGACWYSTFDLRSSYHQVVMKEEDSEKTAFICREGQFKFKTMPFGLCNAGATFQRLMDLVMSGLNFEVCLVYLDDVIVFSSTMNEHFDRLRVVLSRLKGAGLKLKPSKCHLLQKHVAFLGHIVSEGGVSTDPEKIRAVTEWPVPTHLREVRAFVGLCSYYRRFVEGFAGISAPLHDMTRKGRSFQWTPECQEAFQHLKAVLTSAPILAMPDEDGTFTLDTDAANSSIGAVLSQTQNGLERVVAYASRKLSKAEMNYCVTRRELLAVVYFVKYFKHYLLGRKFVVRTDHSALQWLKKTPEPIGQQARWIGFLEEFEFDVVHRPGRQHQNADALSRRPCRSGCCDAIAATVIERNDVRIGAVVSTSRHGMWK